MCVFFWGGKVTARLQVTGFPIFSLLPAGVGEPMAGRFEEEARDARAEMRRKVALDEIDRAKERQARDFPSPPLPLRLRSTLSSTCKKVRLAGSS